MLSDYLELSVMMLEIYFHKSRQNKTDKYGTKLTTISNFPVYLKISHNKSMWEMLLS